MEIFDYPNHREYLKSYLAERKSAVGVRTLARKAGFKSPGHLTMLVKGQRRLTVRSAELLAQGMALKGRKRSLLLAFARLDMAKTENERAKALEEILRLKSRQPELQLEAKQYAFLAVWYYPVVYALLHCEAGSQATTTLAKRVGRGVSAGQISETIDDLFDLGLIEQTPEGRWRPLNTAVTTPENVRSLAVGQYHRNSVKLAGEALEQAPALREFNGLTVTVPDHLVPRVKEKIRRLRVELGEMLGPENGPAEVFQINLQFFPLTQGLERNEP
ncbi:MAG: TIGR02147 family protein [Proteobacteria bacterium]|nr:MAG: TIGR02147 family protein [Pseudomonadota bacterium]